jgi:predicted ATPase
MATITVKDFGPISEAAVELKPLTVLIGPNNTGKSYLALAIYSLQRSLASNSSRQWARRSYRRSRLRRDSRGTGRRLENTLNGFEDLRDVQDMIRSGDATFSDLPEKIQRWLMEEFPNALQTSSRNLDYELQLCFGQTLADLGKRLQPTEKHDFSIELSDQANGFVWSMRCRDDEIITENLELPQSMPDRILASPSSRFVRNRYDSDAVANYLLEEFSSTLCAEFAYFPHYLPATRSGILQAHKTLAGLIINRAVTAWIEPMEIDRMPGVIADLIQAVLSLPARHRVTADVQNVITFLETKVTTGTIDIRSDGFEYPDISYTNAAGQFEFYQVSSMVSETAPLILFLKHLVSPGDYFIIEEPESHLDPYNQTRLARAIAMMVNAGVHVLVTTHSDILLNQFLNLVQASQVPSDSGVQTEYADSELLDPDTIGAYLFYDSGGGTRLQALDINPESSSLTELADSVHRALYDESIAMEHGGGF